MHKADIYCAQAMHWWRVPPSRQSVSSGWQALKGWRLSALLAVLAGFNAMAISGMLAGQLFAFAMPLHCLLFLVWMLHYYGYRPVPVAQLTEALRMVDGDIYVGDFRFPPSVNKLLLGRLDVQGPAFIHLAWHGGQQWVFPLEQLPAVRTFFRQHAPHIGLVLE